MSYFPIFPAGSTAFVPSVAGLIIAGEIVNDLAAENGLI